MSTILHLHRARHQQIPPEDARKVLAATDPLVAIAAVLVALAILWAAVA